MDNAVTVSGRIGGGDGGRAVARVVLVARGLRGEREVAAAPVGEGGTYRIDPGAPLDGAFLVRAVDAAGKTVAESDLVLRPRAAAMTIDLVPAAADRERSELRDLAARIAPALEGLSPADLGEEQVALLAARVDLEVERVALYVEAARSERETGLPLAVFFALGRAGLGGQLGDQLAAGEELQRRALASAVRRGVVGRGEIAAADAVVDRLGGLAGRRALEARDLTALLAAALPGRTDRQQAVAAGIGRAGGIAHAVAALDDAGEAAALGRVADVLAHVFDHVPLVTALLSRSGAAAIRSARDLVSLGEEDWIALLEEAGTPRWVAGADEPARRRALARALVDRIERAFPTAAVARAVAESDLPGGADLAAFFARHPDLELAGPPFAEFLAANPEALSSARDPDRTARELGAIQRLFAVSPRFAHIRAFLEHGDDSAHRISHLSRRELAERYAPVLGGLGPAVALQERADDVAMAAAHLALDARGARPAVVREGPVASVPSWPDLFRQVALCACRECRSVLGPAAYLVDLFRLLAEQPARRRGVTALDVLAARRPDLLALQLSCENTATELPLIDVVIEILEDQIAPAGTMPRATTPGTTEDRLVGPAFVNRDAYQVLAGAAFPHSLPLSLGLETARAFLPALGLRRAELVAAFAGHRPDAPLALALEELGLGRFDRDLLIGTAAQAPWTEWGFSAESRRIGGATVSWTDELSRGAELLRRARLDLAGLRELVATRLVGRGVTVDQPSDDCDLDRVRVEGLTAGALQSMATLLRLRRATGWSVGELDAALAGERVDDASLRFLAGVARLRSDTRLPLGRLLGWWRPLDTSRPPGGLSPYEHVFANPAVTDPVDPALALRGGELAATAGDRLRAHDGALTAALGVGPSVLDALIPALVPDLLTAGNLSALHRLVELARAARLEVADLAALLALAGEDPFADPAATLRFLDRARALANAGLSPRDLVYLLTDDLEAAERELPSSVVEAALAGEPPSAGTLADGLGLPVPLVDGLLARLHLPGDGAAIGDGLGGDDAVRAAAYRRLHRAARVVALLRIEPGEIDWLFARASSRGWLDLDRLGVDPPAVLLAALERSIAAFALRARVPGLLELIDRAERGGPPADLLDALAADAGMRRADLEPLVRSFELELPAAFRDERAFARLLTASDVLRRLRGPVELALGLAGDPVDLDDADALLRAARSRYREPADWLAAARPARDLLRRRQRDALLDLLLHRLPLERAAALSDRLLVDVEIDACQTTSRIQSAIASTQTFIQRCLLNLEAEVTFDEEVARDWEWMSRYRVWEANRKVLLYPENWIEPERRDDKSPLFEAFENLLTQNEITADSVETALAQYLAGLEEVARLDVRAAWRAPADAATGAQDTLHLVARTLGEPRRYFYRRRNGSDWAPWEALDLDIEGNQLVAAVFHGRLYLFWPELDEQEQKDRDQEDDPPMIGVRLAWSRYRESALSVRRGVHRPGSWEAKRISVGDPVIVPLVVARKRLALRLDTSGEDLVVLCREIDGTAQTELGRFTLSTCRGEVIGEDTQDADVTPRTVWLLPRTEIVGAELREQPDAAADYLALTWLTSYTREQLVPDIVLNATPGRFRLTGVRAEPLEIAFDELVYQDPQHTFLIQPVEPAPVLEVAGTGLASGLVSSAVARSFRRTSNGSSRSLALAPLRARIAPLVQPAVARPTARPVRSYRFIPLEHPYACDLVTLFFRGGVDALYAWPADGASIQYREEDALAGYDPVSARLTDSPVLARIDFAGGPYSLYNWELFFHLPFLVATRLRQNERFDDAERWFRTIFDPTDRSSRPAPARYWRLRPFADDPVGIALPWEVAPGQSSLDSRARFAAQITAARRRPFEPHLIARLRPSAFQKAIVLRYADNLIAWGDSLFRQATRESLQEAGQVYALAARILGERPPEVAAPSEPPIASFAELMPRLGDLSPMVAIEDRLAGIFAGIGRPDLRPHVGVPDGPLAVRRRRPPLLARTVPYFCTPRDAELDRRRDLVADRMFKLRHCRDIDGIALTLPLFEPPIDPALLVRAHAGGVDLGAALAGADAALPPYRFTAIIGKANELAAEVRGLGSQLLAALEKRDAEALARLRQEQEERLGGAVLEVRRRQAEEARETHAALVRARKLAARRFDYYSSIEFLNPAERAHLQLMGAATLLQALGQLAEVGASSAFAAPQVASGFPVSFVEYGGQQVGHALQAFARGISLQASLLGAAATQSQILGGYRRRADDWRLQADLAKLEVAQHDKQIEAADLRRQIAERERQNQELVIENARAVDAFLHGKFTSRELYDWTAAQLAALYHEGYRLALHLARAAQRAYRHEIGSDDTFIGDGHWDSMRKGLLAGERLQQELRRMEVAYLERNRRDLELTHHISVALLDPVAVVRLKTEGRCEVDIPEAVFELAHPGHIMRRIKSLAISIPCVTGPYGNLHGTVQLTRHRVRTAPGTGELAVSVPPTAALIALSSGNAEAGLFEVNLRDERYLPFEGVGAVSTWSIELPRENNAFDLTTITDVVFHMRYTAHATDAPTPAVPVGPGTRLLSARHEAPADWHRFLHPEAEGDQVLRLALWRDLFPFRHGATDYQVGRLRLVMLLRPGVVWPTGLPVTVVAPDGRQQQVVLEQVSTALGTIPQAEASFGSVAVADEEADARPWEIRIAEADVRRLPRELVVDEGPRGATHVRLRADHIADLGLLFDYSFRVPD